MMLKNQIIDINKTMKDYGFSNGDSSLITGGMNYSGNFKEKKFYEKTIISDLIKEKNKDFIQMDSPSRAFCGKIFDSILVRIKINL